MRDPESVWTIEALKAHFDRVITDLNTSIDRRFTDSQRDVDKALAAVKSETKLSLDAAEKAITKAEGKQDAYNTTHNDLIRKNEKLTELTMPRKEIEARIESQREHEDEARKNLSDRVEQVAQDVVAMRAEMKAKTATYDTERGAAGWVMKAIGALVITGAFGLVVWLVKMYLLSK